jgi:3-dehydroquinate synthase
MVKYAIIADAGLFEEIVEQVIAIQRRDLTVLSALVARCLVIKARLVAADERETADNQRVLLNFGHTLGHALEQVSGYGVLLHGEAVAIGMHFACQLATQLGYAHASMVETLSEHRRSHNHQIETRNLASTLARFCRDVLDVVTRLFVRRPAR